MRTPCSEKTGLKRGAWIPEEDQKLAAYIKRYGTWNWRELPKYAGLSRCGKSCRLRWMNYLRPNIKRGNYTSEEEEIIINLHEKLGNRWSTMAARLPGRTDNEIKNYWHTHLKKRSKQNQMVSEKAKLQSMEISGCESNRERESESNALLPNPPTPPVLESSSVVSLSPQQSSCDFSSSSSDSEIVIGKTQMTNEYINSSETFVELNGNFWTEPFLVEDCYMPYGLYHDDGMDFYHDDGMGFYFNHLKSVEILPEI